MGVKKNIFAIFVLTLICSALIAHPLYASPRDELAKTQQDMEESRSRQASLEAQSHKVQDELRNLKEKLVKSAAAIGKAEADLAAAEDRLRILNDQLQAQNAALKAHRKQLASLLQAAMSLSRTPPEAMVMMPGDAMETMQAARALKMVSEAIKRESESIARQIGELEELKQKVTNERDELSRRQIALAKEREALDRQIKQRTAMQAKLGRQQEEEAQKLANLAKRAADLQDLVGSLEENDSRKNHEQHAGTSSYDDELQAMHGHLRSFASAMGHIRQPASGRVTQRFGGGHGLTSKGIIIATHARTQVIAPFDGEVVYAGTFLNYGQMVIIRHNDDFHTLLAGLAKINVEPGEFLLEGEPIGAMGEGESGNRLYLELRKDNQPVDPAPWITGLNHGH